MSDNASPNTSGNTSGRRGGDLTRLLLKAMAADRDPLEFLERIAVAQDLRKIGVLGYKNVGFQTDLDLASKQPISHEQHLAIEAKMKELHAVLLAQLKDAAKEILGAENYLDVATVDAMFKAAKAT